MANSDDDKDPWKKVFEEIDGVREQSKTDFEFALIVCRELNGELKQMGQDIGRVAKKTAALSKDMAAVSERARIATANLDERITQVEGRLRLQDQRFSTMLKGVDATMADNRQQLEQLNPPSRAEFEALQARVERLEQSGHPPAA